MTYIVDLHDTRKQNPPLHVSMLRQWHTPVATSYFAEETSDADNKEEDFPDWRKMEPESLMAALEEELMKQ